MKNHAKVNGRLIQTNKKYAQLKQRQKEKIINWLYQETKEYVIEHQAYPSGTEVYDVVDPVYKKHPGRRYLDPIWRDTEIVSSKTV